MLMLVLMVQVQHERFLGMIMVSLLLVEIEPIVLSKTQLLLKLWRLEID
jgi:hypothetical protein